MSPRGRAASPALRQEPPWSRRGALRMRRRLQGERSRLDEGSGGQFGAYQALQPPYERASLTSAPFAASLRPARGTHCGGRSHARRLPDGRLSDLNANGIDDGKDRYAGRLAEDLDLAVQRVALHRRLA